MLEVIDKGSTTEAHPVPRLFVGGAYHAALCWAENVLGFFAARVSVSSRELARPRRKYAVHTPELVFNRRLR